MHVDLFHPLVKQWFAGRFAAPTDPQRLAWPHIDADRNTLIAAPTGSGKTLAAFLVYLDRLVRRWLDGNLQEALDVVYVSPLKALSNDIECNLQGPLEELAALAEAQGHGKLPIRAAVRTGDTPGSERQAMLRRPPHILATTPESLYLLLTSERGRQRLRTVSAIIVDEIHALARDKRGSHLSLSLERLDALCDRPPVRIGLSATQRPIDQIARFLVGVGNRSDDRANDSSATESGATGVSPVPIVIDTPNHGQGAGSTNADSPRCEVIDVGHIRDLDLALLTPESELSAVCSNDQWEEIYNRLIALISAHRSTLIFVNTRRLAERIAHHLTERLGEEAVASHHGSLSRKIRLSAERRLKEGSLKAIVATASLELGIDVGYIDLVCQIGSPRSIATFLQRVGRSGHSLGALPKGRLVPLTRDELLEGMALVRSVRRGFLDEIEIPQQPLDILAQQIVAAVACEEWDEDQLFELFRQAWPYRNLARKEFETIVDVVSRGVAATSRRGAYLHRDRINGRLRARRGARLAAITSGGAIPENAEYRVVTEPEKTFVGTVDEDFAIESMAGDVFLLGNTSWQIQAVRSGEVQVHDANGAPPTIPFWFGEAPGRTVELSAEISRLRSDIAAHVQTGGGARGALDWIGAECGVDDEAGLQAVRYVEAQVAALGMVPTHDEIVFERFFDESGGMQLVIHAPLGARINRAWGLALRKRFCRSFDFELQAAATDNGIVLSLSPQHSFPLDKMFTMLRTDNARYLLEQALLAAPMFQVRWRWNITRSLAVLRRQGGQKVPPHLQRFRSDDLLAAVFPQTVGCLENHHGDIEIPDHPLVHQTVYDCLHEAMDIDRWLELLAGVEAGRVKLVGRDTREPSPFSHELLNANPYAFLDDAPLEERRSRAVMTRRSLSADDFRDLARLDPQAISDVRRQAWPWVRDADELHDALMSLVAATEVEAADWQVWLKKLSAAGRATKVTVDSPHGGKHVYWIAAERLPLLKAVFEKLACKPAVELPAELAASWSRSDARVELVRGRIAHSGPLSTQAIAELLALDADHVHTALEALEGQGVVLRGSFTGEADDDAQGVEWCERRLLARIHRLTLEGLRQRIQPVEPQVYLRFLLRHHHIVRDEPRVGSAAVRTALAQLQGFELPAGAWEGRVLAARFDEYDPQWLDQLFFAGEAVWGRLRTPQRDETKRRGMALLTRTVPISLALREDLPWLIAASTNATATAVSPVPGMGATGVSPVPSPLHGQDARGTHKNEHGQDARGTRKTAAARRAKSSNANGNVVAKFPARQARADSREVYRALAERGALFFQQLASASGLLPTQLEEALRELSALGLATCDSFAAVRAMVERRNTNGRRYGRRSARPGNARSGRWSVFPGDLAAGDDDNHIERWCRQLLARYGVVFRDLLTRESAAPRWRELASFYRRLELRGEIRGGRFVAGVAGEQFADESAVAALRRLREAPDEEEWVAVSAADPVNLIGIVTSDDRIAATHKNTLIFQAGRCLAYKQAAQVEFLTEVDPATRQQMIKALHLGRRDRIDRESIGATASVR